jgi:hypothetical protein
LKNDLHYGCLSWVLQSRMSFATLLIIDQLGLWGWSHPDFCELRHCHHERWN